MLSRVMPCPDCGDEWHYLRCEAVIDALLNVLCPCRGVPIPGVYLEES